MRNQPPENLVRRLQQLKLATPAQLQSVAARVKRLAGDLPDFESVWVDALAQARVLTRWQAAEINADRGESLVLGAHVLTRPLPSPHYAACYAACHVDTGRSVRLYLVRRPQPSAIAAARALTELVDRLAPFQATSGTIEDAGISGQGVWAVCPAVEGVTAAEWMVENGRFSPQVVLHIARTMLEQIGAWEPLQVAHGDIGAAGLLLQTSGHAVLPMPGLRGIVRPQEGYSFDNLACEAYDYLAPERVADGTPPNAASDFYACGCLWWHLLTGRPPLAGGNSLAKLKSAHAAKITDVRQWAPDVPEALAQAIEMCTARDPRDRPRSVADLVPLLGPPARSGCALLARAVSRPSQIWQRSANTTRRQQGRAKRQSLAVGAAAGAILLIAGLWPFWKRATMSPAGPPGILAEEPLALPKTAKTPDKSDPERKSSVASKASSGVVLAAATSPIKSTGPEDLVLSAGSELRMTELNLKPRQRVRGAGGKRPLVILSQTGLVVDREDVCFEGIDFRWQADPSDRQTSPQSAAMFYVTAASTEFRACSFSSADDAAAAVVLWTGSTNADFASAGELAFSDCVFRNTVAIVDSRPTAGADSQAAAGLSVALRNSLCIASGPIVQLHRAPKAAESVHLALDHVTTRGDSAILQCSYRWLDESCGEISISAADSAFDANPRGGLLIFSGSARPDAIVKRIVWTGEGSLVTSDSALALWRSGNKKQQVLAEDNLDVGGLVRSRVEFAGSADGPLAASRITRWQAPLRSDEPPGANTNRLHFPAR